MSNNKSVGILGIGTYLPEKVRTNDAWPSEVVEGWRQKRAAPVTDVAQAATVSTAGARCIADAMAALRSDPFHGALERRVMPDGMLASEMEKIAAERAIEKAGVDPKDIGFLLCNTLAPDYLVTNNACLLHHNLGLEARCFTMATEAACNAFMMQLALAEQMIGGGRAKLGLLVQTCNISPLLPMAEPHSAWFGDGCAATVVGPVQPGRGVLAHTHRTNGSLHRTIVASVPNGRWHEDGRIQVYSADHEGARRSFLDIADNGLEVVREVLAEAKCSTEDVKFYAPHQPTRWFRGTTQDYFGLQGANSIDTFAWAGSMFGANIPLALSMGEREGLLRPGDLALMFAGGAGLTYSSMALRWGC